VRRLHAALLAALVTLAALVPCRALAERIQGALTPDISDAPWCEGIVFDIDIEEPEPFPSPIPRYQTAYADVSAARLRALTAKYGLPKPEKETWYNGRDDINRRNFVFCEANYARYKLYTYPWGSRSGIDGHPQEEKLRAAMAVCRQFLEEAGITGIEEPYFIVRRLHDDRKHILGEDPPPDAYDLSLERDMRVDGDRFTGIGFRYTLGGLPIAVLGLYDPEQPNRKEGYYDSWGGMTVRDDGVITHFELTNYREVTRELEPYTGPVVPWPDAVDTVLNLLVHHTYAQDAGRERHLLDDYTRVRVSSVSPSLAYTPSGRTFAVWEIVLEAERRMEDGRLGYLSYTQYVNAVTGQLADAGEDMTP